MNNEAHLNHINQEITQFFNHFTLHHAQKSNIDTTDKRAIKQLIADHFEEVYPAFAQTSIFAACNKTEYQDHMILCYRQNFELLLQGIVPTSNL